MQFKLGAMKTHPAAQTFGSLDVELRVPWLEAKGDPLSRLATVIDWEGFRPLLVQALAKPAKGPGGRPANDPVKMFKLLVVQRYYNWSDEPTEYQVSDRLSFQKFAGWTVADREPDANPLWDCREALMRADVFEQLAFGVRWHRVLVTVMPLGVRLRPVRVHVLRGGLAGVSAQASGTPPAWMAAFSARGFRCRGTSTKLAATSWPACASSPCAGSCCANCSKSCSNTSARTSASRQSQSGLAAGSLSATVQPANF